MPNYMGTKTLLTNVAEPFLKQLIGGKKNWVEPFAGLASMFSTLKQKGLVEHGFLNDANAGTVNMLKQAKDNPEGLIDAVLNKLDKNKETTPLEFMRKLQGEHPASKLAKATNEYILTDIAGKAPGIRNSYDRAYKMSNPEKLINKIIQLSESLQDADITHGDWKTAMPKFDKNATAMFDPPYVGSHKGKNYGMGTKEALRLNEQIAEMLRSLPRDKHGLVFNTPKGIDEVYSGIGTKIDFGDIRSTGKVKQPARYF